MQKMTLKQGQGQNANQTKTKSDLNIQIQYFIKLAYYSPKTEFFTYVTYAGTMTLSAYSRSRSMKQQGVMMYHLWHCHIAALIALYII